MPSERDASVLGRRFHVFLFDPETDLESLIRGLDAVASRIPKDGRRTCLWSETPTEGLGPRHIAPGFDSAGGESYLPRFCKVVFQKELRPSPGESGTELAEVGRGPQRLPHLACAVSLRLPKALCMPTLRGAQRAVVS